MRQELKKRGKEAMDRMNILPQYEGMIIHDHWKAYFQYDKLKHAFYNAHHLCELNRIIEMTDHEWAKKMTQFLTNLNHEIHENGILSIEDIALREKEYDDIINIGEKECLAPVKEEGRKGPLKKGKERCLLVRFKEKRGNTFIYEESPCPFYK